MTSRSIHLRHHLNRGCIFGIEFDRIEELSLDLIDLALQAIDGTKIEAVASKHGRYDLEHNAKLAAKLDQSIKELQCDIEQASEGEKERVAQLRGWVLRSGTARGADSAFEAGADVAHGEKEIYLIEACKACNFI